jgi:F-type H+-transporting ATPase subunit b
VFESFVEESEVAIMRNALIKSGLASSLVLLVSAGFAWTQEHEPTKAKLTYRGAVLAGGKEEEKVFELQKPEDAEQLIELLKQGQVESLERERPPNFLELRWDLGLWTIVVFGLLLWILSKLAWKPMLEGLQKREETIRGHLEEARRAGEDAKKLRSQLQQEMDRAQDKVRQLIEEGRRNAESAKEEILAKTRSEIQSERDRLHRELNVARDQALHEIWAKTAELATLISAKAIRRQLNADDHRRLVDEAIGEIRSASEARV